MMVNFGYGQISPDSSAPETFIIEGKTEKHLLAGSYDVNLGVGNESMDGDAARSKQSFDLELDE